jgi:hypothetical protein
MLNCSSLIPRSKAKVWETSRRSQVQAYVMICAQEARTTSFPLSLAFVVRSTSGTEDRKSTLFKACFNVSTEAIAAKGVSTRINAGDRIDGHLIHTYTTLEHLHFAFGVSTSGTEDRKTMPVKASRDLAAPTKAFIAIEMST